MSPLHEHRVQRLRDGATVASHFGVTALSRLLATVADNANTLPERVLEEATAVAGTLVDGNRLAQDVRADIATEAGA